MRQTVIFFLLSCVATGLSTGAAYAANAASGPAEDGQWTMPAKDYAATRYSGLTQINAQNARSLHPLWTFSTGVLGGHEGQPLVVGETMYVVTPWPNVLYAFDLRKEGLPAALEVSPGRELERDRGGLLRCRQSRRVLRRRAGSSITSSTATPWRSMRDSGRELWKTAIADVGNGETVTMAPLVVGDRVVVGASGGEFGIYGWLKALDFKTGNIVWTGHNLGPDRDMLAAAGTFRPLYDGGVDVGAKSWAGDSWKTGGAPVWGWISYDQELNLIYYGTGNAAPYDPEARLGDNKWSASVLARRPGTGELVWAYQFTPHDNWDYDATGAMVLVDLTVGGRTREGAGALRQERLRVHAGPGHREGAGGRAFAPVTWAKSVDLASGRPVVEPAKQTGVSKGKVTGMCPSLEGGGEPGFPAGLLAAHPSLLHIHQ